MNYNDYGTLLKQIPELGRFIKLSERAFEIYINAIEKNRHLALTPPQAFLIYFSFKQRIQVIL